jgi:SAM-dependent methyltransferase
MSPNRPDAPDYSAVADAYARTRPHYPPELFAFLASLVEPRRLAWDCATGSGQAAVDLAEHFERVLATDLDAEQVARARAHPRVTYRVASAEKSGIASDSIDLVTVAAAVHWFDLERFFEEVRRVVRPGGVLAAWSYHVGHIEPPFDEAFAPFYRDVVAPYFAAGAKLVDDRYEGLELPGEPIVTERFHVIASWDLAHTLAFVDSWSGTHQYIERRGRSPVPLLARALEPLWGDPAQTRVLRWPLYLRVSRL